MRYRRQNMIVFALTVIAASSAVLAATEDSRLTCETAEVLSRLRKLPSEGRYVYAWRDPWGRFAKSAIVEDGDGNCRARNLDAFELGKGPGDKAGIAPLLYTVDFNLVTGTWKSPREYRRSRASLSAMVRKGWKVHRAVPIFSSHFENPYVPPKWTDSQYGNAPYRYRHSSPGYPREHRYVIHEILTGTGAACGTGREDGAAPVKTYSNPKEWFDERLAEIAEFLNGLRDDEGRLIPVVVRLPHECEDDWQWWGCGSVSKKDFIAFCRCAVARLREQTNGGRHLMFAYSPDRHWEGLGAPESKNEGFLSRYPGDDVVDIVGFDDYSIGNDLDDAKCLAAYSNTVARMAVVTRFAEEKGKAAGLFETGPAKSARNDAYEWLDRAMTDRDVGFGFCCMWGESYMVPTSEEGRRQWLRFVNKPHVMTAWKATWNSDEKQATVVVEMQGRGGVKLPDLKMRLAFDDAGRTTLKIPRELLEGASAFSIRADFLTAKAGEPGYWIAPDGMLGRFELGEDDRRGTRAGKAPMPFYGMKTTHGTFVAIVSGMETDMDVVTERKNGVYSVFARFASFKTAYEDVEIHFRKLGEGEDDYSGMARAYRSYQLSRGAVVPIRTRIQKQPLLAYAAQYPEVRVRMAWKPVPSPKPTQTIKDEPPVHAAITFDRFEKIIDEFKRQGVPGAEFCLVGWNVGGHDGRWPQVFPVEPSLGGEEALKRAIRHARNSGYQVVAHANHRDAYLIADSWDSEYVREKGPDGSLLMPKITWGGGAKYTMCPQRAYERFAVKDMPMIRAMGFEGLHYLDVFSCERSIGCEDPRHPLTTKDGARYMGHILRLGREVFGGIASEGGFDFNAGELDYVLYVYFADPFGKMPKLVSRYVPLFQLVYNGIILSNPFTVTVNAPLKGRSSELKLVEYGARPTFYYYANFRTPGKDSNWMGDVDMTCGDERALRESVSMIKRSFDVYSPLMSLQYEFLEQHDELASGLFRLVYSNGTKVYVNYGKEAKTVEGLSVAAEDYVVSK